MKKILVTGATGSIGRAVVRGALERGFAVRAMARRRPDEWNHRTDFSIGSVENREVVARAIEDCDAVIHLATALDHTPRTRDGEDELRKSIVEGTRVVAEAARRRSARLAVASTISVYAKAFSAVYDESTPPAPESLYGRAKLEAEGVVGSIDPGAFIARIAPVYGPYARGNTQTLIRAMKWGIAVQVGDGSNRNSIVYVENLADRLLLALESDLFGPWIAADDAPTQRELLSAIADALGKRRPRALPLAPVLAVGRGLDLMERLARRTPLWSIRARRLASSMVFSGDALDVKLGYEARISLEDGIARTLRWMTAR
jgi:nucleoside-diphosphate-sugar epimerase